MEMTARFSVLMAFYARDRPGLLEMALGSIYANTVLPDEVVLVQDGPVGVEFDPVLEKFAPRAGFRLLKLATNRGLAEALNFGLSHVRNEIVFRADADDINLPGRFAAQLPGLLSGLDVLGGAIEETDETGASAGVRREVPCTQEGIARMARFRNPFNHMTVAFRLGAIRAVGGYPAVHLKEDYALWALLIAAGARMGNLGDVLVRATAGRSMYERRGGLRYVRSEIQMQKLLVRCGLQSVVGAVLVGLSRSIVFLLPAAIRGVVYERALRSRVSVRRG